MSEREEDYDSDAPEEFSNQQGIKQDENIRKIQKENKASSWDCLENAVVVCFAAICEKDGDWVRREGKERRRIWAQRKTPRQSTKVEKVQEDVETETDEESQAKKGMLPTNIVEMLASREKQVFLSDSEDEKAEVNPIPRKKKKKNSGVEPVILNDMPAPQCLQSSLEFLKKRKMQVPRSSLVLKNSNQVLRLSCAISTSGLQGSMQPIPIAGSERNEAEK
ncbi:hypothetical protein GOBAR_AA24567 [Gossypium barbadense]|uniref:Uncharacterized protein n=1 Tax=Gossypium barbadense TaxID=3634 RepID=A0A2P5WYC4_GOSBA|nr:hypothetical protein GOBAR_AA24567 [Gossypium barbadense]